MKQVTSTPKNEKKGEREKGGSGKNDKLIFSFTYKTEHLGAFKFGKIHLFYFKFKGLNAIFFETEIDMIIEINSNVRKCFFKNGCLKFRYM